MRNFKHDSNGNIITISPIIIFKNEFQIIYKNMNIVPMFVHRLLLYDDSFPKNTLDCIDSFKKNIEFHEILWKESDIINIMNSEEAQVYKSYKHKIQKSDYARYIVLKYFGGIYCDLDIYVNQKFETFYQEHKSSDLFFEEITTPDSFCEETKKLKIRNGLPECNLRIANYIMMCRPFSNNIQKILDLCNERKDLNIEEDYDIIYTTGPDVISQFFFDAQDLTYLKKNECDKYFTHQATGHWRNNI